MKSVMEKADQILANMGISDATPLSEAAPAHAVGKKYNEALPEVSDEQRTELLEGIFVPRTNKKVILKEGNQGQTDTSAIEVEPSSDEEILKGLTKKPKKPKKLKMPKPDTLDQMDANAATQGRAYAQKRGSYPKIVADSLQISKLDALNEMTGVGSLGVSMANSSDPEKPYTMTKKKKSKKKNKKSLTNFLNNAFVTTPKGY